MDNQIVCPSCKKAISNNPIIDAATTGNGTASQALVCECGERITFWQIKAQLRDQKTMGWRFRNWVRSLTNSRN